MLLLCGFITVVCAVDVDSPADENLSRQSNESAVMFAYRNCLLVMESPRQPSWEIPEITERRPKRGSIFTSAIL